MTSVNLVGARNPFSNEIDVMAIEDLLRLFNEEERAVPHIVAKALPRIAEGTKRALEAICGGGRLIMCGAGSSSGRLVAAEAAQLEPSYGMDPTKIIAIAFGTGGSLDVIENFENKPEYGEIELKKVDFTEKDVVLGVSATGGTPAIVGCFAYAEKIGALKIALCCNIGSKLEEMADIAIVTPVGPEVITESARHKGSTAHKMVLDMITSCIVVKLGYTYGNIKVGLPTTTPSLRERGVKYIMEATKCSKEIADAHLSMCGGDTRTAVFMILNKLHSNTEAEEALRKNDWRIRS